MSGSRLPDDGRVNVTCQAHDWHVNNTCQACAWHMFAMWLPCAGHLNAMWLPPGVCLITAKYHSHYHNHLLTGVMVGNKEATTLPAVTTGTIKREGGWVSSGGKLTRSTSAPAEKYQMKEWPIPKVWVSFTVAQYFLTTVNIAQDFLLQREHFFNSGISWQMMSQEPFILPAGAFCSPQR